MTDKTPIRESSVVQMLGAVVSGWALLFSVVVSQWGDHLTSKQWIYLMSIPGGKFTWAITFLAAGLLIAYGMVRDRKRYKLIGAGWGIAGGASMAIAAFYFGAPYLNQDLFTLGYFPWAIASFFLVIGAVVNWKPVGWF